jgi:hypothetical protein
MKAIVTALAVILGNAFTMDAMGTSLTVPGDAVSLSPSEASGASSPPMITRQPESLAIESGMTADFSVEASGEPAPSYQWLFNDTIIVQATNHILLFPSVQPAHAGNYSVVVSNEVGSVVSSNAVLTVLGFPPTIIGQPQNQSVTEGGTASFSLTLTGTAPLNFQWYFNEQTLGGLAGSMLTLTNVQPLHAGVYWAVVSNAYGMSTSAVAQLVVMSVPECVTRPAGAVAWWKGEGDFADSAGMNDAGLSGSAVEFVAGKVGSAFRLAQNQLQAQPSASLNVGTGAGFTIEGWIHPDNVGGGARTLIEWRGGLGINLIRVGASNIVEGFLRPTNSPQRTLRTVIPAVHTLQWHHVAMTYDRVSGVTSLYVDGQTLGQTNFGAITPMTFYPVTIGNGAAGRFYGAIDELTIYNRALTAAEIQLIHEAAAGGKCSQPVPCLPPGSGLVAWWRGQSNTLDNVAEHHAVPTQQVAYVSGRVGDGFAFAGGYMRVPAAPELDLGKDGELTVEAWINPVLPVIGQPLLQWDHADNTTNSMGLSLYIGDLFGAYAPEVFLVSTAGVTNVIRVGRALMAAGLWQHVAFTFSSTNRRGILYYNGEPVAGAHNLSPKFVPRTTGDLFLGYRPLGPIPLNHGFRFRGQMDEIAIYNRELDAAEIAELARNRSGRCTAAPHIVQHPASLRVSEGQDVTLRIVAAGNPQLRYQWQRNGEDIADATTDSLRLADVDHSRAGLYTARVTNWFGAVVSSNAVLQVNRPPVADAGATLALLIAATDGSAKAVLDGTRSLDPDGDVLDYTWQDAATGDVLGTGAVSVVTLPLGANGIRLRVDDGLAHDEDTIVVEVVTAVQAVNALAAAAQENVNRSRPLSAVLSAALAAIDRSSPDAAIHQLAAFQHQVRAQVLPLDATLAQEFIQQAQWIIDALRGDTGGRGAARITRIDGAPGGKANVKIRGEPQALYLIEASPDLMNWRSIGTVVTDSAGVSEFEDAQSAAHSQRFYRAVAP